MKDAKGHGSNGRGGRLAKPIPGHYFHSKSNTELRFIAKDAAEAGRNAQQMGDERGVSKYADQVADAATVLGYRDRGGKQDAEGHGLIEGMQGKLAGDIAAGRMLASGAKSVAAPVHDSMARSPGQSDRSYISQRLTDNASKSAGIERAPGESDASYIRRRIS